MRITWKKNQFPIKKKDGKEAIFGESIFGNIFCVSRGVRMVKTDFISILPMIGIIE